MTPIGKSYSKYLHVDISHARLARVPEGGTLDQGERGHTGLLTAKIDSVTGPQSLCAFIACDTTILKAQS